MSLYPTSAVEQVFAPMLEAGMSEDDILTFVKIQVARMARRSARTVHEAAQSIGRGDRHIYSFSKISPSEVVMGAVKPARRLADAYLVGQTFTTEEVAHLVPADQLERLRFVEAFEGRWRIARSYIHPRMDTPERRGAKIKAAKKVASHNRVFADVCDPLSIDIHAPGLKKLLAAYPGCPLFQELDELERLTTQYPRESWVKVGYLLSLAPGENGDDREAIREYREGRALLQVAGRTVARELLESRQFAIAMKKAFAMIEGELAMHSQYGMIDDDVEDAPSDRTLSLSVYAM